MKDLIIFILSSSGLTWILCKSKLFKKMRESISLAYKESVKNMGSMTMLKFFKYKFLWAINEIFNCPGCMGFWAGVVVYIIQNEEVKRVILCYGFMGSIASLIIIQFYEYLNRR